MKNCQDLSMPNCLGRKPECLNELLCVAVHTQRAHEGTLENCLGSKARAIGANEWSQRVVEEGRPMCIAKPGAECPTTDLFHLLLVSDNPGTSQGGVFDCRDATSCQLIPKRTNTAVRITKILKSN